MPAPSAATAGSALLGHSLSMHHDKNIVAIGIVFIDPLVYPVAPVDQILFALPANHENRAPFVLRGGPAMPAMETC